MKKNKFFYPHNFVAIDFETATSFLNSACAIGMVKVQDLEIVDTYYSLIQPPNNFYDWRTIRIHGIEPFDTIDAPTFLDILPTFIKFVSGYEIVAHNESFDRRVLKATLEYYNFPYDEINIKNKWICTVKLAKKFNILPAKLNSVAEYFGIELKHHNALSDAKASALIYINILKRYIYKNK